MMKKNKLPNVVVFGRTNVGKSTLFNILTENKHAIVSGIEGTTRDSNIGIVEWRGLKFNLVDTGGIIDLDFLFKRKDKTEKIEEIVQKKVRGYLKNADIILFVVDGKSGLIPQDREMSLLIKKVFKNHDKILLVVNKIDGPKQRREASEFHKLSMGEPFLVSAANGSGTGDMLDVVVEKIKDLKIEVKIKINDEEKKKVKICLLGKPNVGKSSLINKIIGEDRILVSNVPHTTREPQDIDFEVDDDTFSFIDTAGINKKGTVSQKKGKTRREPKTNEDLARLSIRKSLEILNKAHIALFVFDINEKLTKQDSKLIEEIIIRKKSLIIIANKWDLVEEKDQKKYTEYIYDHFPYATWAPIHFMSAKTGSKLPKLIEKIVELREQRKIEISESQFQKFLARIVKIHKPAKGKGLKHPHIFEIKQERTDPPIFMIRIGSKDNLHFSYVRFIENRIREKWGFRGCPITLRVVHNPKIHGQHEQYLK